MKLLFDLKDKGFSKVVIKSLPEEGRQQFPEKAYTTACIIFDKDLNLVEGDGWLKIAIENNKEMKFLSFKLQDKIRGYLPSIDLDKVEIELDATPLSDEDIQEFNNQNA